MQLIPAFGDPFSRVLVDCVRPLPKAKSGTKFILTIICAATHFPEDIPLMTIMAPSIVTALVKLFSMVGVLRIVQSNQNKM